MTQSERRGHTPTLVASFLHFDLSFMLWVLIGALGALIARDLHLSPAQKEYDRRRTRTLERAGIRVLRFWNNEVLQNLEGVLERILEAVRTPSP